MAQSGKHAVLLTLRSVSMQRNDNANAMQTMQCNAIQCSKCNAMQCNAIQCNVQCNAQRNVIQCSNAMQLMCTEVRPSVRNEVSQSFLFFFAFFTTKMTKSCWSQVSNSGPVKWKSECTDGRTYGMKSFLTSHNDGNLLCKEWNFIIDTPVSLHTDTPQ
jgi:hypothetical protein